MILRDRREAALEASTHFVLLEAVVNASKEQLFRRRELAAEVVHTLVRLEPVQVFEALELVARRWRWGICRLVRQDGREHEDRRNGRASGEEG